MMIPSNGAAIYSSNTDQTQPNDSLPSPSNGHSYSSNHSPTLPPLPIDEGKAPGFFPPFLLPSGSSSLSGISLRSNLLGLTSGLPLTLTLLPLFTSTTSPPLPRLPLFLFALSTFHFLEYYTTARFNTTHANISAFLLTSNGLAYNLAHTSAILEYTATTSLWPRYSLLALLPSNLRPLYTTLGFSLMILGQAVRSTAMAQAGQSFNHTVQQRRRESHILVTEGVYSVLRHPSYFGFFWWAVGTQVWLGNGLALLAYVLVLWKFFRGRIEGGFFSFDDVLS
jgi:protein-S-isoprenylcysteine O-methyltransferase